MQHDKTDPESEIRVNKKVLSLLVLGPLLLGGVVFVSKMISSGIL